MCANLSLLIPKFCCRERSLSLIELQHALCTDDGETWLCLYLKICHRANTIVIIIWSTETKPVACANQLQKIQEFGSYMNYGTVSPSAGRKEDQSSNLSWNDLWKLFLLWFLKTDFSIANALLCCHDLCVRRKRHSKLFVLFSHFIQSKKWWIRARHNKLPWKFLI